MKISWHKTYNHPLAENHKFPMKKYDLLVENLLKEDLIYPEDIIEPNILERDILELTHSKEYIDNVFKLNLSEREVRKMGFPLTDLLVERELRIMQGTINATLNAIKDGVSFNIAGGTHHASTNKAEGFCIFNDIAVASNYLLHHKIKSKILVIDLDVHQGNGTAEIFKQNPNVFTFSMHAKDNYPLDKEISDLDIDLPLACDDYVYLEKLIHALEKIDLHFDPDFVFYQSGVDILESDKFGKLKVSLDACKNRDEIIINYCKSKNLPFAAVMGGGYSEDINIILEAHLNLFRLAFMNFV